MEKLLKSDEEWKKILTKEQYSILREKGTEMPGTCSFSVKKPGIFYCVACDNPLFISEEKFESGTGWPSFFKPYSEESIILKPDNSLGMQRTEVLCSRCEGHLGHVFEEGHKRYCINGIVLKFKEEKEK